MCNGIFKSISIKLFLHVLLAFNIFVIAAAHADVNVEKAWVQLAPPNAKVYAAYLQLQNPSDAPLVIQSITSTCCARVAFHRTRVEKNKAVMEHLDDLTIPANGKVVMKPGALHIMLMDVASPITLDDEIELVLHFSGGEQQTLRVPVIGYGQ